ncbi:MAG: hypothetical protein DRJ38_00255 [Thermoprotei archaeon]|nr:MAG: hypothetical protein DRJ38_00255 [Thermoprotei archaeon]
MLQLKIELKRFNEPLETKTAIVYHQVEIPEEFLEALRVLRKVSGSSDKYSVKVTLEGGTEVRSDADLD